MLTVEPCSVAQGALVRLTKEGIEWLVLTNAKVNVTDTEGDYEFETLERVASVRGLGQEERRRRPEVNDALNAGASFENFDWEGDVRNRESF